MVLQQDYSFRRISPCGLIQSCDKLPQGDHDQTDQSGHNLFHRHLIWFHEDLSSLFEKLILWVTTDTIIRQSMEYHLQIVLWAFSGASCLDKKGPA